MPARSHVVVWACSALLLMQLYCLMCKIPYAPDTSSIDNFTALRTIGPVSFGYVFGQHGATLIWSKGPPKAPKRPWSENPELAAVMLGQLKSVPVKATLEYLLYVTVTLVLAYGPTVLSRLWHHQSIWATSIKSSLITLVGVVILSVPLSRGYDTSIYTTYAGPGALSSSGPYFGLTMRPGIAVSYRIVLEALGVPPARLLVRTHLDALLPDMPWWLFYAVIVGMFYTIATYLVVSCWAFVTRHLRRSSAGNTPMASAGT